MGRFDQKVLLLTGAGSGIGRASALKLASEGAKLYLTDVNAEGLAETVQDAHRIGGTTESSVSDISNEEQAKASVAACVKAYGRLDVLCNNAGVIAYENAHDMSLDFWRRILSINLDGTFLMTREALPHLLETRGAIVNIGSTAGLAGLAYASAYRASKGAVHAFTRALAVEYADRGIRANSICPASIQTGMSNEARIPKGANFELLNRLSSLHGNAGPEVVADLVVFLASDEAKYISGEEIRIDGAALA